MTDDRYPQAGDSGQRIAPSAAEIAEESFFAAALVRINRLTLILVLIGLPVALLRFGVLVALGWAVGGIIAWHNFRSLAASVNALGERIVSAKSRESGGRIVAKFVLRYALFAVAAYVIFKVSVGSLYGMLAGLSLPVIATLCEAVHETYFAFRRGV
jgi:hypothetical protein